MYNNTVVENKNRSFLIKYGWKYLGSGAYNCPRTNLVYQEGEAYELQKARNSYNIGKPGIHINNRGLKITKRRNLRGSIYCLINSK